MLKIPVIILNYNSSSDCRKCVSFLKPQQGVELEIIIVDNCSPQEGEQEKIRMLCQEQGCTFISASENRGYSAGNNIGLRYAAAKGYEYALVINPDVELQQPEYLERLAGIMEKDNEIVVCGSDIVTPEGIHQNPKVRGKDNWRKSFDWLKDILHRKQVENVPTWVDDPSQPHFCRAVNGCCFMIKIDFLEKIGFFDEKIFLYGEETILGRQVELAGDKIYYFADVQAVHSHVKSKEGGTAFCSRHWKHSQLHYIRQYSGYPFYGKLIAILSCIAYFAVLKFIHLIKRQ
jgi:GT2 family glycosyltransferase